LKYAFESFVNDKKDKYNWQWIDDV